MMLASTESNLHNEDNWLSPEPVDTALGGLESLILAHAVAGVNIEDPAYQEGVWTAVDAICNNC